MNLHADHAVRQEQRWPSTEELRSSLDQKARRRWPLAVGGDRAKERCRAKGIGGATRSGVGTTRSGVGRLQKI